MELLVWNMREDGVIERRPNLRLVVNIEMLACKNYVLQSAPCIRRCVGLVSAVADHGAVIHCTTSCGAVSVRPTAQSGDRLRDRQPGVRFTARARISRSAKRCSSLVPGRRLIYVVCLE
jgi:hypothetical protein